MKKCPLRIKSVGIGVISNTTDGNVVKQSLDITIGNRKIININMKNAVHQIKPRESLTLPERIKNKTTNISSISLFLINYTNEL